MVFWQTEGKNQADGLQTLFILGAVFRGEL
jgi:hypothetical protein